MAELFPKKKKTTSLTSSVMPGGNALPRAVASNTEDDDIDAALGDETGKRALALSVKMFGAKPDLTALNDYARQRQGNSTMELMNALAAQRAGDDFKTMQQYHAQQSRSNADPIEYGDYGYIADGAFHENPYKSRQEVAGKLFDVGKQNAIDYRAKLKSDADFAKSVAHDNAMIARLNAGGGAGGRTMTERLMTTIMSGNPADPEYAMAYNYLGRPRTTIDQNTGQVISIPGMDLSRFPKPAGTTGVQPTVGPNVIVPQEIRDSRSTLSTFDDELKNFKKYLTTVPERDRKIYAATGVMSTKMADAVGSYNNLINLARDKSLFNTGVMQPGEVAFLKQTFSDPGSIRGYLSGDQASFAAFGQVERLLRSKLKSKEQQIGLSPQQRNVPAPDEDEGPIYLPPPPR